MNMRKLRFSFVCVAVLFGLMIGGTGGRLGEKGILDGLVNAELTDSADQMILSNCVVKSVNIMEAPGSSVYLFFNTIFSCMTTVDYAKYEIIPPYTLEVKQRCFECLIRKGFHLQNFRDTYIQKSMYHECLQILSPHGWRRLLADQTRQNFVPPVALAPSPSQDTSNTTGPNPHSATLARKSDETNHARTIVIIVVPIFAAILLLLGCAFCCYRKCCRETNDSINGKDEKPLLTLSLSEFAGSSKKSFRQGGFINKEKIGTKAFKLNLNQNGDIFSLAVGSNGTLLSDILAGYSSSSTVPKDRLPKVSDVHPSFVAPPPALIQPPPPTASPPPPPPPAIKKSSPPPAPPLPTSSSNAGPRPPPPPKGLLPGRAPKGGSIYGGNQQPGGSVAKAKLKPFFWDKVPANPDQSMVWDHIKSGSFQFSEEKIETLFGYNSTDKNSSKGKKESSCSDASTQCIQLLDPKKSQNLAISLKALNVKAAEVCEALMEGNELPSELLHTLLRMQPTEDEEQKLRSYSGDLSLLGPGEQLLKLLIDIPFALKRIDVLLFMSSLHEDVSSIKNSFATLEVACTELKSNRLFLKLLEAVLKTGNRMNDGTNRGCAQAFKLDTLLKLSDVKGSDGKTTLLHFVVQEIIRSEGVRAARLARESESIPSLINYSLNGGGDHFPEEALRQTEEYYLELGLKTVLGLSSELENVKKAAAMDFDALKNMVASFGTRLTNVKEFLNTNMKSLEENSGFHDSLKCFIEHAAAAITFLLEEDKKLRSLIKETTDYFHGNAGKDNGLALFVVVRDFLGMLDKACKEVRISTKIVDKAPKSRSNPTTAPTPDTHQLLSLAITDRHAHSSSDK